MRGRARESSVLVAVLIALAGCASEPTAPPTDPAATGSSVTADPSEGAGTSAPSNAATTTEPLDPGPYAGVSWDRHEFGLAASVFQIDDVYVAFDSSAWRAAAAEAAGETPGDDTSYYWWSLDGDAWERNELPDMLAGPESWWFSEGADRKQVTVWGEGGSVALEVFLDVSAADGAILAFGPAPEVTEVEEGRPTLLPEMEAEGLIPVGWAPTHETNNSFPAGATVGAVTLVPGTIEFSLPEDVAAEVPEWNGATCCRLDHTTGGVVFDYQMDNRRTHSVSWAVDGSRLSAVVTLFTGDEPQVIHSGWAEFPAWLKPVSIPGGFPSYGGGELGFAVFWRSEDGGAYAATQPEPFASFPALGSEDAGDPFADQLSLIEHDGRFLAFGAYIDDSGSQTTAVWSSSDGTEWTLEAELRGFFEVYSLGRHNNTLSITSDRGVLFSSDGIEWIPVLSRGNDFFVADQGFIWVGGREIRISTDSITWHSIPLPEGIREPYVRIVGDLLVVSDSGELQGTWIAALP